MFKLQITFKYDEALMIQGRQDYNFPGSIKTLYLQCPQTLIVAWF
jgi:hypothetical protein